MHLKRDIGSTNKSVSTALPIFSPSTAPPIPSMPMSDSNPAPQSAALPPKPSSVPSSPFAYVSSVRESKLAALEASGSSGYALVSSPTVGSFRSGRIVKGKKQPPSCKEGAVIKEGQVIGYLDQFGNELPIKSDVAGEVLKILFKDGEPVGYGDPIVAVLPSFHGINRQWWPAMTEVVVDSGDQRWWSTVVAIGGCRWWWRWWSTVVAGGGGQRWWPTVAVKGGGRRWWPEVVAGGGGQRWWPTMAVKGGGRRWWPKVVAGGGGGGGQRWWPDVAVKGGGRRWLEVVVDGG
ncbi:hypothetical protein IEQ34_000813 [Dendrobium chrysotoxum]|uniref:Lipoyl-binding domain-containing protein n=1 Tax=Dendrobium chrysotoxum TaxID=161865 RepID=A0AAV7HA26_DENCH|nr:hypothetical protein IEQ34_000813 [Dendrobium chrysotoxum]